jgi:hypothetical protein
MFHSGIIAANSYHNYNIYPFHCQLQARQIHTLDLYFVTTTQNKPRRFGQDFYCFPRENQREKKKKRY